MTALFYKAWCRFHTAYHWFRSWTGIASWAVIAEDAEIEGTVVAIGGRMLDGDFVFDVLVGQDRYHCEAGPCEWDVAGLKHKVASMKVGSPVRVRGRKVYDPPHLGDKQQLEIHPVRDIEILLGGKNVPFIVS